MITPIQPTIPIFQGNGYGIWSTKMRTLFISEDLWELVDKGYVEEDISTDAIRDVRKKDAKALFFIQQAIAENIFPLISNAMKSKEAWDTLQTNYQNTTKVTAQDGDGSQIAMDDFVYKAATKGNIELLREISDSELQVQLSLKHNTILHIASEFGQIGCVKWILELPSCSSLLQRPNLNGDTPLHLAAREGHLEVVNTLINASKYLPLDIETGSEVDNVMLRMTNNGKDTALHEAVRYRHFDVVKLLIEEDPDFIYGANNSCRTPLYMAAERGFTYVVEMIIDESNTSPLYTGFMGRTALHAAVICNDQEMTQILLRWKPDLTKEVDENGWSPLHCAAERGCHPIIVRQLLENSDKSVAYLGTKDGHKTALHIASFHHHTEIVQEILSHSPGCREQVDDNGNNVFHFAMMRKGDDDFKLSNYSHNDWLRGIGLLNEKDVQGNAPIHLLSLNQISDFQFLSGGKVDKKAYNNENLTAYDIILRAEEDISGKKDQILEESEMIMPETRTSSWEKMLMKWQKEKESKEHMEKYLRTYDKILGFKENISGEKDKIKKLKNDKESKEYREKYTSELQKQGETHLIVSVLITTVTFAAGFTLPGGYKEDDGNAILSKKTAFRAFVVTDTIAMVSSLCAVFLHFFMTIRKREKFLAKHLVWAFFFTMIGMGAMAIAFATGLYSVLPHASDLSILTCTLCSCFFLCLIFEFC